MLYDAGGRYIRGLKQLFLLGCVLFSVGIYVHIHVFNSLSMQFFLPLHCLRSSCFDNQLMGTHKGITTATGTIIGIHFLKVKFYFERCKYC
ncbi:hypothetical protein MtrunA17_Chr2g0307361 [Medicago truncatula]|uniref:Transmembrane protein n=1 Tax=Medicago truncatula TaxID=3880 RepID=A0A396JCQ6_MEDTR|nr:hypothetical protein MtrunA17_Chr2g0307361 [Medicago truncatula]